MTPVTSQRPSSHRGHVQRFQRLEVHITFGVRPSPCHPQQASDCSASSAEDRRPPDRCRPPCRVLPVLPPTGVLSCHLGLGHVARRPMNLALLASASCMFFAPVGEKLLGTLVGHRTASCHPSLVMPLGRHLSLPAPPTAAVAAATWLTCLSLPLVD